MTLSGNTLLVVSLFGIGIAALPLAYAAWLGRRERRRERSWVKVDAVVVENEVVPDSDGPIVYPALEFTTRDGYLMRVRSGHGSAQATHDVGASVRVHYDPTNFKQAEILGAGWSQVRLLVVMGALSMAMWAGMIVFLFSLQ